jgi:uncharacterized membrane protein
MNPPRRIDEMNRKLTILTNVGIGAGLMFFLDPDRGRRRRSLMRDKVTHYFNLVDDAVDTTVRDFRHRSQGLAARATSLLDVGVIPDDEVLVARVRSKMGRYISHPSAIRVSANEGQITLLGPILAHEVESLLSAVAAVPGVIEVVDELEVHAEPGDIPELQGEGEVLGERFELAQTNWSPTARVAVGTLGGLLTISSLRRRGIIGSALGLSGVLMLARSLTNIQTQRLVGAGGGRRAIDFQKSIIIDAPVERVYDFWSNFENFPLFMSHVREVRSLGDDRSHWTITGPAGVSVEFDAVLTKNEPNKLLTWKSVEGSTVGHAGVIRFEPTENDGTRLDIRMSYNPPAGVLGHLVATLFGVDPKSSMQDDLVRFKSLIEEGKTTAHGETVTLDEIDKKISEHRLRHLRRAS